MLETFGHYKILDRIGAGGIGELYRARDTRLGRTVAVRVVAPDIAGDPERLGRFLQDARASLALSHPSIAAIYEIAEQDGLHYLACEYVPGQTLKSLVAGRPLNPRRAIDFTVQLADALADAYADDRVHGDVRLETILVTGKEKAKLVDFGLAAWTSGGRKRAVKADHLGDVLSLGRALDEMLTGKPSSGRRAPSEVDPYLPRELDVVVLKALSEKDEERYQAAATMAAELRSVAAILAVRSEAAKEEAVAPVRGSRRREVLIWLTVLSMLGLAAWLVWTAAGIK